MILSSAIDLWYLLTFCFSLHIFFLASRAFLFLFSVRVLFDGHRLDLLDVLVVFLDRAVG